MAPFCRGLHCDSLLQRITLWLPSAEDCIAIPFLQRIALRFPCTEIYIVIPNSTNNKYIANPFCRKLHCGPFYIGITLRFLSASNYLPIRTDNEYIAASLYKGLHYDSLLQMITLWSPSAEDDIIISFYKGLPAKPSTEETKKTETCPIRPITNTM